VLKTPSKVWLKPVIPQGRKGKTMKNALLSVLAGIAMLFVAMFHDNSVVAGLSLMIAGLSFSHPMFKRRQVIAVVLISTSGWMMTLDYSWWPLLSVAGGTFLAISRLDQSKDAFSVLELLIGVSWFGLALPFGCFLAAILMFTLAGLQTLVATIEGLVELFDPA